MKDKVITIEEAKKEGALEFAQQLEKQIVLTAYEETNHSKVKAYNKAIKLIHAVLGDLGIKS